MAGEYWVVDETPTVSDAIVILGDDNYYAERAERAAQLFRAGDAPRVVASGRFLRPYATVADLMLHDLKERGIPENAIVRFTHRAANTQAEAAEISHLVHERGWKKILLVTSSYHTRRSRYIFERVLPPGTELRVVSAPDTDFNPDRWWETHEGRSIFFHEAGGMLAAWWENRHVNVDTSFILLPATAADHAPAIDARARLALRLKLEPSKFPWFRSTSLSFFNLCRCRCGTANPGGGGSRLNSSPLSNTSIMWHLAGAFLSLLSSL
jgi:hypothetical protein